MPRHHHPDISFSVEEANPADIVFSEEEANPADIVFSEAEANPAPAAAPADTAQAEALANARGARIADGMNSLGATNDTLNAVNGFRSAPEVLPAGYRGAFLPRNGTIPGTRMQTPAQPRVTAPMSDRLLGGLGVVTGGVQAVTSFIQGMSSDKHEDRVQAAFGVGEGALGASGGVATMAGATAGANTLGFLGGALEEIQGIRNVFRRGADVNTQGQGGQQMLHGGLSALSSLAGLAESELAPVLGAGAAGASLGSAAQQRAEAVSLEQGRYTAPVVGRGLDGQRGQQHISASDAAAREGLQDAQLTHDAIYNLTGNETIAHVARTGSGYINTGVHAVYNTLANLW